MFVCKLFVIRFIRRIKIYYFIFFSLLKEMIKLILFNIVIIFNEYFLDVIIEVWVKIVKLEL